MQVTYFSDMFEPFIIMQIAAVFTWAFVFLVLFGFFANKFHLKKRSNYANLLPDR